MGPMGPTGPEGAEGPPGLVESFYTSVEGDQGIAANTMQPPGTFAQTPFPATLDVSVEAGTYLLTWHAEVMRTNQSSTPFYVRLREGPALDGDGGVTYGFLRQRSAVENGPAGNIPEDNEPSAVGDVIPFSGSAVLSLPDGDLNFRIEYAIALTSSSTMTFLRAQHQRISLLRLE